MIDVDRLTRVRDPVHPLHCLVECAFLRGFWSAVKTMGRICRTHRLNILDNHPAPEGGVPALCKERVQESTFVCATDSPTHAESPFEELFRNVDGEEP